MSFTTTNTRGLWPPQHDHKPGDTCLPVAVIGPVLNRPIDNFSVRVRKDAAVPHMVRIEVEVCKPDPLRVDVTHIDAGRNRPQLWVTSGRVIQSL